MGNLKIDKRTCLASLVLTLLVGLALPASAVAPQDMLRDYEMAARQDAAAFKASTARGEAFFRKQHATAKAADAACAGCHGADPRQSGRTRANKSIEALAPVANRARFTDPAKTEKWFGRNCGDVLGRPCTAAEKADFIAWLINLK